MSRAAYRELVEVVGDGAEPGSGLALALLLLLAPAAVV
jgi:hypothetical protein